jgi:hypothetical protein
MADILNEESVTRHNRDSRQAPCLPVIRQPERLKEKGTIMAEKTPLNENELEQVAGGASAPDAIHDLKNFVKRTVCNVIMYDETACLTLRKTPAGEIIQGVGWQNGDTILVHKTYKEDGWYFAYNSKKNKYGYVNPNNVK